MADVLYLCDHSGAWSKPWLDAGYDVMRVDLQEGQDVRTLPYFSPRPRVILAAPPCDHLANSGARWWAAKGEPALLEALAVVDACLRLVAIYRPIVWAIENPSGRLSRFLGPSAGSFDPCDYGDPYTKRTHLWGEFTLPQKNPIPATEGSKMHLLGQSKARKNLRSKTPSGFAEAFFLANKYQVPTWFPRVLEYWNAKDWDAIGAADATAAKLVDMKAGAAKIADTSLRTGEGEA